CLSVQSLRCCCPASSYLLRWPVPPSPVSLQQSWADPFSPGSRPSSRQITSYSSLSSLCWHSDTYFIKRFGSSWFVAIPGRFMKDLFCGLSALLFSTLTIAGGYVWLSFC